jgi:hypothetical protein
VGEPVSIRQESKARTRTKKTGKTRTESFILPPNYRWHPPSKI